MSDREIHGEAIASTVNTDGLIGIPIASSVAEGRARVIEEPSDATLEAGEVLVASYTDPGWTPVFLIAPGLVANVGGKMTHGSIVADREFEPMATRASSNRSKTKLEQRTYLPGFALLYDLTAYATVCADSRSRC